VTVAVVGTAVPLASAAWRVGCVPSGDIVSAVADGGATRTSFVALGGRGGATASLPHDAETSASEIIDAKITVLLRTESICPLVALP
jgi:hypothetical protein